MTSTRRLAFQPMESSQAKSLGDAIVLRLEVGTSESPSRRFHAARPVPAFTIGTGADWKIDAPGVAPIHAYLKFDGHALFVATADPEDPALVDERPAPETWLAISTPCTIALGAARLAIDSRVSSEFPAALPPPPDHADVATRIDIQPLWSNQVEKFEAAARELTRTAFDPSVTTEVTPSSSDGASEARFSRRARFGPAILLVLGAVLVSAAAYHWIVPRLGTSEPATRLEAPVPSSVTKPGATAILDPPPTSVPPPPVVVAPVAPAPAVPAPSTSKTVEREAVDALTAGDFAKASKLYRALAETHPNQPAFKEALRILEERSRPR